MTGSQWHLTNTASHTPSAYPAESNATQLIRSSCTDNMTGMLHELHRNVYSLSLLPPEIARQEQLNRYIQVATLAVGRGLRDIVPYSPVFPGVHLVFDHQHRG